MKKVFLFLATAALFASCADDMLEPNNGFQASNEKGITFQVVDDATRGMIDTDKTAFFFAEKDRVNIWAINAKLNGTPTATTWSSTPDMATYKATRSKGNPNFTSVDDQSLLEFKGTSLAQFFVAYPIGQTVSAATANNVTTFTVTPNQDLSSQDMNGISGSNTKGYNNIDERLMYDFATAQTTNDVKGVNASVGEKVDLSFHSPLSTIFFSCSDLDTYEGTLGQLNSITFSSEYSALVPTVAEANYQITAGDLVTIGNDTYLRDQVKPKFKTVDGVVKFDGYEKASATAQTTTLAVGSAYATAADQFTFKSDTKNMELKKQTPGIVRRSATLNVNGIIAQGQEMALFVLPVEHTVNTPETYTIAYKFANVDLSYPRTVTTSFTAHAGWTPFKLNIAKEFPYLLTKGNNGSGRTLIVNSSTLKSIFDTNGKVKWTDTYATGAVPVADITKVIIGGYVEDFDDDDWTKLNTLTATTELTINNLSGKELKNVNGLDNLTSLRAPFVTSVAKDAFDSGVASGLQVLDLRSVQTSFKKQAGATFDVLTDLNLAAYNFQTGDPETEISPEAFFNDDTKSTLQTVDLSSVTSLSPTFGYDRDILFTDYDALTTIKLNPSGTIISSNEFMDCDALATINGAVKFSTATSAFEGCGALDTVYVQSPVLGEMVIPANAFKDSGVKFVIDNATQVQVVPTSIGAKAFQGNTAIDKINLTQAIKIGESAFDGATAFEGLGRNHVVTLIVDEVKANTFNGTMIQRFQLINATKIGQNSLNANANYLKQIKFMKKLNDNAFNTPVNSATTPQLNIFIYDTDDTSHFPVGTSAGQYKSCTQETTAWEPYI